MVVRAALVRVVGAIPPTCPTEVVGLADPVVLAVPIKVAAEVTQAALLLVPGK